MASGTTKIKSSSVAARLRAARVRAGMTPIDAARYLRVARTTIYDWERGTIVPRADRFEEALRVYGEASPV